jgi:hypothetical protein
MTGSGLNALAGTILAIEWADGTAEYEVVCDYDTPVRGDDANHQ